MKIYLFRHGQTYYNRDKIFTGWKDSQLTPLGIIQAKGLAQKLKSVRFTVAYQSRLNRSKETLKEVLDFHPECKTVITDDRMIERSYGKLSGQQHTTIIKKYGQAKFDVWHRGYDVRPPGGESFADVYKRVSEFAKEMLAKIRKEKINVAISAHGNSIRIFRKVVEHTPVAEVVKWQIPYDKVFEYTVTDDTITLQII